MSALHRGMISAVCLTAVLLAWLWAVVSAQKAEKGTQQWTIPLSSSDPYDIRVVDTTGVCLYVINTPGMAVAITAISKATLPVGAGCQ